MLIETAITCLALNIYWEGATINEPIEGLFAVAQVAYRRANGEPEKVCKVLSEPKQFSWLNGHTMQVARNGQVQVSAPLNPNHKSIAWAKSVGIARMVILKLVPIDYSKGAMFYHAGYVSPQWATCPQVRPVAQWGNHKFFSKACTRDQLV